jgi:hypothetical protein
VYGPGPFTIQESCSGHTCRLLLHADAVQTHGLVLGSCFLLIVCCCLCLQMMALETMISIKFGRGLYTAPWPRHILFCWAVAGTTFACVLLVWQYRLYRSSSSDRSKNGVAGSGSTAKGTAASCSTAGETGSGRQASINGSVRGRRGGAAHKHL